MWCFYFPENIWTNFIEVTGYRVLYISNGKNVSIIRIMTAVTMRIFSFNMPVRDTRYRHHPPAHFRFPRYLQLNFLLSISGDTLSRINENTLRLRRPCWYPEVVPHSRRGPITCQYRHYWRTERNINVYDPMCVCSIPPDQATPF